MAKTSTWQNEIINLVSRMSNRDLLEYFIESCNPDDYDGEWTDRGAWKKQYLEDELKTRLKSAGWLD